ncbi:MAG: hypothetical protein A2Z14_02970 [Chloroflexi bacterium RBG_16_48_8]|nr:MAG: hypothetical protein A2Z14_02970 [Chloroflexi bacterium RBG_16_48_8]
MKEAPSTWRKPIFSQNMVHLYLWLNDCRQALILSPLVSPSSDVNKLRWEGIIRLVEQPPEFLTSPLELAGEETFQPAPIPRRGGMIAWIATLLIAIVAIMLIFQSGQFPCLTIILFLFFLIAAILVNRRKYFDKMSCLNCGLLK